MSKIYEKDHKGQIRSRKPGDYGNEKIEYPTQEEIIAFNRKENISGDIDEVMDKVIHPVRKRIREEVLDELWAADKLNHEGYWYIKLSDAIKIISGEI